MSIDTPVQRSVKARRIEVEMTEAGRHCKRQPYVIGTAAYPTAWDLAHQYLDGLICDWEAAR